MRKLVLVLTLAALVGSGALTGITWGSTDTAATLGTSLPARMHESDGLHTVFVSPSGNDSNSGTIGSPVKTLSKAFSLPNTVNGAIIDVRAGTFTAAQSVVNKHFSSTNPVTVRTYPGDAQAVFGTTTAGVNNVYFGNDSGVRLRNLKFSSATALNGLKLDSVTHFDVDGNVIGPNGSTASTGSQGILVSSSASGVGTSTITSDLQVYNNTIFNWYRNPSQPNGDHGIYTGVMTNSVIANNVIYNTISGGGYGIQLGGEADNSYVVNNTVDGITSTSTGTAGSGMVVWGHDTAASIDPTFNDVIENNLLTNEKSWGAVASGSTTGTPISTVDYNLTFNDPSGVYDPTFGTNAPMFTVGTHNITGDPLYANRANKDFHLNAGSPAGSPACRGNPAYVPAKNKDGITRTCATLGAY